MPNLDAISHAAVLNSGMRLIWACCYNDGTIFNQFQDGRERSFEEVDRTRLVSVSLLDARGKTVLMQEYSQGQYPLYRRRTVMRPGQNVVEIVHILGWRMFGEADKEIRHVLFLYESDFHVECGDFRPEGARGRAEEWRYPIQYLPSDNVPVG